MTCACEYIHDTVSSLPRLRRDDVTKVPANGIYLLSEKGELGHGVERIVRVGTHRGLNNLAPRIREHLYTPNKDRSIFRKHVGLAQWEIDLTTKASREMNAHKVDRVRLHEVETEVTQYMVENFSFAVLRVDTQAERLRFEECLLSTIFDCRDCLRNMVGEISPYVGNYQGVWSLECAKS
jgi:hypothetical protein